MHMGPYELLEVVGRGGTGTVHRARHGPSGKIVAVKVMFQELADDLVLLRRFEQEVAAARRLNHPNIVGGLDLGMEQGVPYLVMEFVEGKDLANHIRDNGPLAVNDALRIILQISDAVRLAHSHKLIHRDIKPENVLLALNGTARLTDLGLIKDLDSGGSLTRSRACLGTASYMAPEQFEDARHADPRSDIYGLASTLYFALTGLAPFRGRGNLAILRKKLNNEFVPLSQVVPGIPAALDAVVSAALNVLPDRRPASCDVWMAALRGAGDTTKPVSPAVPAPPPAPENRRRARRYPANLEASCRKMQGNTPPWQAEVQDISLTGMRLELDRRFEVGTVLTLGILDSKGSEQLASLARVCWVREAVNKKWSMGCVFNRPLADADLDTMLESRTATVVLHDPKKEE